MSLEESVMAQFKESLDAELVGHLVAALDTAGKVRARLADENGILRIELARLDEALNEARAVAGVANVRAADVSERARMAQAFADGLERQLVEKQAAVSRLTEDLAKASEDVVGLSLSETTYRDELEAAKAALARSQAEVARLRKRAATPPASKPPRHK